MEYDHEAQVFNFISGLIVGAVLGAGIALLTAPDSGPKTRKRLRKTTKRIRGEAEERWDDLADEVKGRVDDALKGARKRFS